MTRRIVLLIAAVAVIAASCGDGGPDPTPEQGEAFSTLVDVALSGNESRCLLEGLIDSEISPEAILDGSTTADQDATMLAVTVVCIDDLTRVPSFVESFIAGAAEEGVVLSVDEAKCAIASLDDPEAAATNCIVPTADADDADGALLNLLRDSCAAGNNQSCDDLYETSPLGSDHEDFARTCAGRLPDSIGDRCFLDLDS